MQKVKVQGHMRPKVDLEAGVVSNWSVHWTGLCC